MSAMLTGDVEQLISMAKEYAQDAVKRGDVQAPCRLSEMSLCAHELCDCGGSHCGGCAASLKFAGVMDDLVPRGLSFELNDEARSSAREAFTRQREAILAFARAVARKVDEAAEDKAAGALGK